MHQDKGLMLGVLRPRGDNPRLKLAPRQIINFKESILTRDQFKCRCCGMSHKSMFIFPKDSNPNFYNQDNYLSVCQFCHDTLSGGMIGGQSKGRFIYLPQVPQTKLNWLFYSLSVSMQLSANVQTSAMNFYRELGKLTGPIEEFWGENASTPQVVSALLSELPDQNYLLRNKLFFGFRFLPDLVHQYSDISAWKDSTYNGMERHHFHEIYKSWTQ